MADSKITLTTKLLELQQELITVHLTKSSRAHYGRYLNLEDLLDGIIPVLHKHGFVLLQVMDGEDLVTELRHELGTVQSRATLHLGQKKDAQSFGSSLTYTRRYSLIAMLGLMPDSDDDGNGTVTTGQDSKPSGRVASRTPRMQIGQTS